MDLIEKIPDETEYWYILSCNSSITADFIEKNIDKCWNGYFIREHIYYY